MTAEAEILRQADVARACADESRPLPQLSPSEFADRYRILHEVYCTERPGRWNSTVFPYQRPLQDMVQEAIETGRRGVVYMKSAQGGGTDLAINGLCWLKVYYPGPQLFMTATDKVASEFGRERFENIIKDMPPLAAKYRPNARGDILAKRFSDGRWQLAGGQSIHKLHSTPYRHVGIDELDSLVDNLGGEGDPLKLAEARTDSFVGETLFVCYAHPSTKDRGAAKIFYEQSDQRRGFVAHASCGQEFWLKWDDVKCTGEKNDPDSYVYACPHCGEVIPDSERVAMVCAVDYRSVLPPEQAAQKTWIGAHFSQLYYPNKTLRGLAQRWIECGEDINAIRVFYNKVLGEPYEPRVKGLTEEHLRRLIVVKRRANDPEFYLRGHVPPGVRFLTAGQDSRTTQLHHAIWGWGLRRGVDGHPLLCGWLIDWGEIERAYSLTFNESEFHVYDDLIYNRRFPSTISGRSFTVVAAGHDIGYAPTQVPIIRYCRNFPGRAFPTKGASLTATSATTAPVFKDGVALKLKAGEEETIDHSSKSVTFNTYLLKNDIFGWLGGTEMEIPDPALGKRTVKRLTLPEDVDQLWIDQSKNEALAKGKRTDELVYLKIGPNHLADCNMQAYGLALRIDPFQDNKTADEYEAEVKRPAPVHIPQQRSQFQSPDGRAYLATER